MSSEKEIRAAFDTFDKDGSGKICTSELKEILVSVGVDLSESQCKQLIQAFDRNNSGFMEFDEFKSLVTEALQHSHK